MSTKRPHKKSRFGCDPCRKRRVKCDEQLPLCTTCKRRGETCHFSRYPFAWKRNNDSTRSSTTPTETQTQVPCVTMPDADTDSGLPPSHYDISIASPDTSNTARFRELELMHHWCTKTCDSFSQERRILFRDHVVGEAFRFDFLMEALLALTSLHVACEAQDTITIQKHVGAALQYQTRALRGLRTTLSALSQTNCDAVFLSASLVMVCSIVSPLISTAFDGWRNLIAETMLTSVDLVKGVRAISQQSRAWLGQGPLEWFSHPPVPSHLPPISTQFPLQQLRDLVSMRSSGEVRQIFEHAIDGLEQITPDVKSVVPWLLRIKPKFLEELEKEDNLALAIFMHWAVMLDQLDDMWWAKFSARRLVEELSITLNSNGQEWRQVVASCRAQVGLGDK